MQWIVVSPTVFIENVACPPGARGPVVLNSGIAGVSDTTLCSVLSALTNRIRSPLKITIGSSPKAIGPRLDAPGSAYTLAVTAPTVGTGEGDGDIGASDPHALDSSAAQAATATLGRRNFSTTAHS